MPGLRADSHGGHLRGRQAGSTYRTLRPLHMGRSRHHRPGELVMTAETDLLPLVGTLRAMPEHVQGVVQSYARANIAHATAPLQAEIKALRAEVERANSWNERVSVCRDHVADIVDGPCVICALAAAEARAERLAEAINAYKSECDNPAKDYVLRAKRRDEMFALLRDQEEGK